MEEAELIIAAKQGNLRAMEGLVDRYQDQVYGITLAHTRNREDAADISQEVLIKMIKYIKNFDAGRRLFPWLYSIIMNSIRDYYNRNQHRKTTRGSDYLDEVQIVQYPEMSSEEKMSLFNALNILEAVDREMIILKYFQDTPVKDIAELMNMTESNVKIRLMRARQKMRDFLGDQDE